MFNINNKMLERYAEYTYSRSDVYYQKEVLRSEPPFVESGHFLESFKFTNVKRYLDKQSKYMVDTLHNSTMTERNKVLNTALFRMYNLGVSSKWFLEFPIDFENMVWTDEYIEKCLNHESNVQELKQSNAYFMVAFRSRPMVLWGDKGFKDRFKTPEMVHLSYFVHHHQDAFMGAYNTGRLELATEYLVKNVPAYGDFTGYQLAVDWSYMSESPFTDSEWVRAGPGACEGIDWFLKGEDLVEINEKGTKYCNYGVIGKDYPDNTYEDFIYWFHDNLPSLMESANVDWDPSAFLHFLPSHQRVWNVMDIQNSMCEFNKLSKLLGGVPARSRYWGR